MADQGRFVSLDAVDHLDGLLVLSSEEPILIYKHSLTCPLSAWARHQMAAFSQESGLPVHEVVVQGARALSGAIAERFGIRHESPQVIVLFRGQPQFHASHRGVSAEAVRQALSEVQGQEHTAPEVPC